MAVTGDGNFPLRSPWLTNKRTGVRWDQLYVSTFPVDESETAALVWSDWFFEAASAGGVQSGEGSSAGVATVSGVGASIAGGVGASNGLATVSGTGAAVVAGVGASGGVATVSGAGAQVGAGVGASNGIATVSGVGGSSIVSGTGSAAGVAAVQGVGDFASEDDEPIVTVLRPRADAYLSHRSKYRYRTFGRSN